MTPEDQDQIFLLYLLFSTLTAHRKRSVHDCRLIKIKHRKEFWLIKSHSFRPISHFSNPFYSYYQHVGILQSSLSYLLIG